MLPTMMMDRDDGRAVCYPPEASQSSKMYVKEKVRPTHPREKVRAPSATRNSVDPSHVSKMLEEIKYNDCLSGDSQHNLFTLRSTVEPIARDSDEKEPFCSPPQDDHVGKKSRSSSFCYTPTLRSLLREQNTRRSLPSIQVLRESRVTFQDHVDVVPVESLKDSPDDIRRKLWISNDELAVSMRQAEKREMMKKRSKLVESQETDGDSDIEGNLYSPSLGDAGSTTEEEEEEGSMEFTDLALCDSLDEETKEVLEAIDRMSLSQQAC